MTPEQLDEIEKLAEAATPGPWRTVVDEFHADSGAHQVALHDCFTEQDADKNAAFIRTMREHTLPLVKALREARAERDEAYRERADWMYSLDRSKADIITLMRERDESRAEVERLRGIVEVNDRRLAAVWDEARAEVERLSAVVQQVYALVATEEQDYRCVRVVENLREIHTLTKEES